MLLNLNGIEVEFDIFDADTAEKYEIALDNLEASGEEAKKTGQNGKLSEIIRMQCEGVIDFVDDIFGDGTAREIFGERTNLRESLKIAKQIIDAGDKQRKEFEAERMLEVSEKSNRAQRRAKK